MIEIPEAINLAKQLNNTLKNKKIKSVIAMQNPHKFAFVDGDPANYSGLLKNKDFCNATGFGSWVQLQFADALFMVSEGTVLLYTEEQEKLPKKHQMLIQFQDDSYLCAFIKMFGGVVCSKAGEYDNKYYLLSQEKPAVLSDNFNQEYFTTICKPEEVQKLSLKALLATEQRIPGLGNGVLQDILFNARLHPKTKMGQLDDEQIARLYTAIKSTLTEMTDEGGRDTEKDLFGNFGGYKTRMSKNTVGTMCEICGTTIEKASYMGGSIYFCPICQPV